MNSNVYQGILFITFEVSNIFKITDKAELLSGIWVGEGSSRDFVVPIRKCRVVSAGELRFRPMPPSSGRTDSELVRFKNRPLPPKSVMLGLFTEWEIIVLHSSVSTVEDCSWSKVFNFIHLFTIHCTFLVVS